VSAFSDLEAQIDAALSIAAEFGQVDGADHKQWVIDQMVRALLGHPDVYEAWVDAYQWGDGEAFWVWDEGIAP
jgi:hypothetical protein